MSTPFRLSAQPLLPVIAMCMLAAHCNESAAGQSKSQLQVKATVVGQCTLRIDHLHPRTLSCGNSQLRAGKDMQIDWEVSPEFPHIVRATVRF
jgi:hypothetical protein